MFMKLPPRRVGGESGMVFIEYLVSFVLRNWGILLCFVPIFWYLIFYSTKRPQNFPPGPRGFPIIGVVPLVSQRPEITFANWGKEYGDVIGFKMGKDYTVVLNSYEAIQEAFVQKASFFSHRPDDIIIPDVLRKKGIGFNDYTPGYIVERKFTHSRLGFGKKSLEDLVIDEVQHLLEEFGYKDEIELDSETKGRLTFMTGNVVAQMVIGKRYSDFRDPEVRTLMNGLVDILGNGTLSYLATATMIFPWLRYVPPMRGRVLTMKKKVESICEVIEKKIDEHRETLDKKEMRDFIDEYLTEMDKKPDPTKGPFSKDMLICIIRDLFAAGMETVDGTIVFSCLVLANRPEIMKKIRAEIDDVIGNVERPCYALREKMPFCLAFLKEMSRYRTPIPLGIQHCTAENVKFRGYDIPKGTTILPNIYAVHNDPKNWDKPDEFNPERHLGSDGRVKVSKYLLPFSIGPRLCIGRRVGEMEMFIFFVMIFKKYSVIPTPSPECERPYVYDDSDVSTLVTYTPSTTPVTLVRRKPT